MEEWKRRNGNEEEWKQEARNGRKETKDGIRIYWSTEMEYWSDVLIFCLIFLYYKHVLQYITILYYKTVHK